MKPERQQRLDKLGITEQELYESRQAEREVVLNATHANNHTMTTDNTHDAQAKRAPDSSGVCVRCPSVASVRTVWLAQGQLESGKWHTLMGQEFNTEKEAAGEVLEYYKYENLLWVAYRVVERSDIVVKIFRSAFLSRTALPTTNPNQNT